MQLPISDQCNLSHTCILPRFRVIARFLLKTATSSLPRAIFADMNYIEINNIMYSVRKTNAKTMQFFSFILIC